MYAKRQQLIQEILDAHNIIRKNPQSIIPKLEEYLQYYKFNTLHLPNSFPIRTVEGPKAVRECIDFLKGQKPVPELNLNRDLKRAAQDHANDIGTRGVIDHNSLDGSSFNDRLSKYVKYSGSIGESLVFAGKRGIDVVLTLLIDDGNALKTQRNNVLSPDFKYIGIGVYAHKGYDTCAVIDYVQNIPEETQSQLQTKGHEEQVARSDDIFEKSLSLFEDRFRKMEDMFRSGFSDLSAFELESPLFNRPLGFLRLADVDRDLTTLGNLPEGVTGRQVKEQVSIVNGKKHVKKIETITYADGNKETKIDESQE